MENVTVTNVQDLQTHTADPTLRDAGSSVTVEGEFCWPCYLDSWQHQAYLYLLRYVPPVLLGLGTAGNLINLAVLQSRPYRKSPSSVSLSALACMDLLVLWTGLLRQWLMAVWLVDVRVLGKVACKLHFYVSYMAVVLSTNILVLATIERALSVCVPLRIKKWITCKRIKMVIITMSFILLLVYLPILIEVDISSRPDGTKICNYYDTPLQAIFIWIDFSILVFMPFAVILFCNTIIIYKLAQSTLRRKELTTGSEDASSSTSSVSAMLVAISIAIIITMTPANVFYVGVEFNWFPRQSELDWAVFDLTFGITHVLMYCNNAINFYIYCLTGSKYRRSLRNILRLGMRKPEIPDNNNSGPFVGSISAQINTGTSVSMVTLNKA